MLDQRLARQHEDSAAAPLELEQWLVCIGAALVIPAVAEIRKLVAPAPAAGEAGEGEARDPETGPDGLPAAA